MVTTSAEFPHHSFRNVVPLDDLIPTYDHADLRIGDRVTIAVPKDRHRDACERECVVVGFDHETVKVRMVSPAEG